MCLSKDVLEKPDVFVDSINVIGGRRGFLATSTHHALRALSTTAFSSLFGLLAFFLFLPSIASAFTVITVSTSAPDGIEAQFIADATSQWNMSYFKNPLASNTYQLKLFGPNENFNPAPTNQELLDALVTVDSYTYSAGYATGRTDQQTFDLSMLSSFFVNCSSPTAFALPGFSTSTFNANTCQNVIDVLFAAFQTQFSTFPIVTPNFQ